MGRYLHFYKDNGVDLGSDAEENLEIDSINGKLSSNNMVDILINYVECKYGGSEHYRKCYSDICESDVWRLTKEALIYTTECIENRILNNEAEIEKLLHKHYVWHDFNGCKDTFYDTHRKTVMYTLAWLVMFINDDILPYMKDKNIKTVKCYYV